jgi:hypothetical protein
MMNTKPSLQRIVCLLLFGLFLLGCSAAGAAQSVASTATARPPSPVSLDGRLQTTQLFTAPNAVIALAADQSDNVYAVVYDTGDVLKIGPDGKSAIVYSGLKSCGFGAFAAIATLPDGNLATYDCPDSKSAVLVSIDPSGRKTTLATLDPSDNLTSMTADPSGHIFLGYWTSGDANLTIDSNPNHLSAAEAFDGYVAELGADGKLNQMAHGGAPVAMTAPDTDQLFVATWGNSGPFSSESKTCHYCTPTTAFWAVLSEQVKIGKISAGQADGVPLAQLDAVSAVAAGPNGLLFAAGQDKGDSAVCGIYYSPAGQAPKKLSFDTADVDKNITALAVTGNALYWGDVDGHIFRVGLTAAK